MALGSTIAGAWYPGTGKEIRAIAEKWEATISLDGIATSTPMVVER